MDYAKKELIAIVQKVPEYSDKQKLAYDAWNSHPEGGSASSISMKPTKPAKGSKPQLLTPQPGLFPARETLRQNVLYILKDEVLKSYEEGRSPKPLVSSIIRNRLKPENAPLPNRKGGKSFTAILQAMEGLRVVSVRRQQKDGTLLPAEQGFLMSQEMEQNFKTTMQMF